METSEILQALFRWIHVVAGILWIGLLYFFNFVNGPFVAKMDGETKKKVVPELMPRALFFFRHGAVWTWVSGLLLLIIVYYHQGVLLESGRSWSAGAVVMIFVTFLAPFAYDAFVKAVANPRLVALFGFAFIVAVLLLFTVFGGYSYRGAVIHLGSLFGTIMAFNVWFRIWPSQKRIIEAVKSGQPPEPPLVALAGLRSRHNTYLSVPLVWAMLNAHSTVFTPHWWTMAFAVALGWLAVSHLYKIAGRVQTS